MILVSRAVALQFVKKIYEHNIKPLMSKTTSFTFTSNENESMIGEKLIYPAATRNKEPILQVLKRFITCDDDKLHSRSPIFLEIASGSGQHVYHFAPHFPGVKFIPSDIDESLLGSIHYYKKKCVTKNILEPLTIDICCKLIQYGVAENSIDYLYNANMIHISPYECTIGLFENAGIYLKQSGLMITYGPYSKDGIICPQSNIDFNNSLKSRNSLWGLRDITDLIELGKKNRLLLFDTIEMPSNNKILVWKKVMDFDTPQN